MSKPSETDLYAPLKSYLEARGFTVKSEVSGVDIVAVQEGGPDADAEPVLIEMKLSFSLTLFHQAVARQTVSEAVYIAVPRGKGRAFQKVLKSSLTLCRRLGLGLLTVRLSDGFVEAHVDPGPYRPKMAARRKAGLLREFARRAGDPNTGGTRGQLVTAYRQDARRLLAYLAEAGPSKGSVVAKATGVARATEMMATNHKGWFCRVERGIYAATDAGLAELAQAEAE
ncbi:DUF2161 domain-containing phosphodiesterase [Pseudoruegeria sp. SHC-113]|uniref:DUF2161 domain-containing phosphodiesterase n=1 Tax=Pseudoruegeria sp. SHC-113 TaxID=2855439 RepID=UPI0021BAB81F|nr:DUF2161 domain-containing phosphodiesterase [Pseudoruegeria sp. SHC-113]MCT8159635.1 DUF2161 domain-containing phosphodiesterase [Pseudoruegeria sp. SHC-113]